MNGKIDLNCDMGESFGAYRIGMDEAVMPYITSANIACGWHAGDPVVMDRTVKMAAKYDINLGAHPGYPDLMGFGRRKINLTPEEVHKYVVYQIGALQAFTKINGGHLSHVKPHGGLYHYALENDDIARSIGKAIVSVDPDLYYVSMAGKKTDEMKDIGKELGLKIVYEAFPDRAYNTDGTLVSRNKAGAVISNPEEVVERALSIAKDMRIRSINGEYVFLEAQTICVHGDTKGAVHLVKHIREALEAESINVIPI